MQEMFLRVPRIQEAWAYANHFSRASCKWKASYIPDRINLETKSLVGKVTQFRETQPKCLRP